MSTLALPLWSSIGHGVFYQNERVKNLYSHLERIYQFERTPPGPVVGLQIFLWPLYCGSPRRPARVACLLLNRRLPVPYRLRAAWRAPARARCTHIMCGRCGGQQMDTTLPRN
jgi:hypothetical protein